MVYVAARANAVPVMGRASHQSMCGESLPYVVHVTAPANVPPARERAIAPYKERAFSLFGSL